MKVVAMAIVIVMVAVVAQWWWWWQLHAMIVKVIVVEVTI